MVEQTIGSVQVRTDRLSNALRYQNATTPGWALLCAKDDEEAREIVLDVIDNLKLHRTNIAFRKYECADPNMGNRYRVEVIA